MVKAKKGDTVYVHCTATLEDGTMVADGPLKFRIGDGKVIAGIEQTVIGMSTGESITEKVPPNKALGPHREELVMQVDRKQIPSNVPLEVGKQLQVRQRDGQTTQAVVADVSESKVTLDANHPLAGKDFILNIKLLGIA